VTTATASTTFTLGDELTVHRLGFGAMRITGPGIWGPPSDHDEAIRVLRRAVELGIDLIDTADSYGPFVSEDLIREALHPYDGVTIATKGGLTRQGPDDWRAVGHPDYLQQCVEMSLRRLDVDTIDLWQLHRIGSDVPAAEQFGRLKELQDAGKIRHFGLSEVGVDDIVDASAIIDVVSVQNRYNLIARGSQDVLDHCEAHSIAFIPWFPIAAAKLAEGRGALAEVADETGATAAQVSLAWLLHVSSVTLPIPGTGSVAHLEENAAAAELSLTDDQVARLTGMAGP
jgi:pyridoxine 4-dehydrogenase